MCVRVWLCCVWVRNEKCVKMNERARVACTHTHTRRYEDDDGDDDNGCVLWNVRVCVLI